MALPPCAPAAASETSEAKLSYSSSSIAAQALIMVSVSGSTSSSGTSSLTTYTSSRDSALSSELGDLASQLQYTDDEEKVKRRQCTRHLVREFCHDALERWLSEMGIGWVLDLTTDDPSAGTILLRAQPQRNSLTEGWIRALIEVMESTHLEYLQCLRLVLEEGFRGRLLRIFVATVLKERFVRGTDLPGRVQLFRNLRQLSSGCSLLLTPC